MRKTLAETFVWNTMAPVINDWLLQTRPKWEAELILEHAKGGYKRMISTCDNIGSRKENPYRLLLDAAMVLIAFYKGTEEPMKEDEFKQMVVAAISAPVVQMTLAGYANVPFSDEKQAKRCDLAKRAAKCSDSEMNWIASVKPSASPTSYEVECFSCGIYALAKRERVVRIAKHLCAFEEAVVGMAGGKIVKHECLMDEDASCKYTVEKR